LLGEGVTSEHWNLTRNLETAKKEGHEDFDRLFELATKISVTIDYEHLRN